ncbi:MAG: hypothetical protein COV91_01375 [Candidatus Taylorbacteria bacterium CG11_big_fil_rev_8_21_14_0_20_46_11]|uniref:Uncharacterized protein n=1 Tax=Candidatus Taylorbacteria bacterium CG11_big_fil_rev_8_21_14_0_20_46_11 TaxID=1975025 RepID=A0A2H0KCJ4_9BACT|nr:MAG: hypothetical protein COV91_01375 [Candidatus Taylorbacteria bacterium CG11_big_fil_rev_8_21_14_0_20_46_11]
MTLTLDLSAGALFQETLRGGRKRCSHLFDVLLRDDAFVISRNIFARTRDQAVYRALQYYWIRLNGALGPASRILTVDDPFNEVVFSDDFDCNDRRNNYLPNDVKARVIAVSHGVLIDGKQAGTCHHPSRSLRRLKRRRKLPFRIRPHVYTDANGTIFYSMTIRPAITKDGTTYQKRKVSMVRLNSKVLSDAYVEIARERLPEKHLLNSRRRIKTRMILSQKV